MAKSLKTLALIPARGGSKGLKLKNIANLNGFPLISYSIKAAQQAKKIDKIVVSTDNSKIKNISEKYGAECPFIRPKKLSTDKSSVLDVVKHTINFLDITKDFQPDIISIMYPTAPFRTAKMIDDSIKKLIKTKAAIVVGVKKIKTHPYRSYWIENNKLKPFRKDFLKFHQRQTFPDSFYPTGAIYTFWTKNIKKYDNIYGPNIKPLIFDNEESCCDIDSLYDLFMNEMKMKHWNSFKKKKII
jgi:CMP-N,N'-diacetyllegionaminic acid synthase